MHIHKADLFVVNANMRKSYSGTVLRMKSLSFVVEDAVKSTNEYMHGCKLILGATIQMHLLRHWVLFLGPPR